jgi:carboxyl-terminal processing protease
MLTVVRRTPEGLVTFELTTPVVRAAPGAPANPRHDLSALKIFNMTMVRIKDRYVDPARVDPKKMLYAALDSVQLNIPEVLVEPDVAMNSLKITVNDKPETFSTDDVDSPWRMVAKLKKIFRFIETNMNPTADLAKIEYAAVNGMLSTLDPHSTLMDPEAARDMDESTSGKFGGLGIVIKMMEGKLTVVKPMKDTPASRAGIKAGDHIVKINTEPTENLTSTESVDRMRGEPKTDVTLWIMRKGETTLRKFDLTRESIKVAQVESKLFDKGVGYIKVKQFSKGVAHDVAQAMKDMSARGATTWVLDLRGNPGGLLEEAVQLSDLFVDNGTVVTTVSGRDREARRAEAGFGDITSPLVLLVNSGSASASEIVAGALKNLDRAVVIGTRTFGKGTVQELYDNEDKSKLKLTIAQYLTPGDRSIQNLGIVPDIALQRQYVPMQNATSDDWVRLLAPSRIYGEKDLDSTILSSYAKDTDKPTYEIPFIVERKAPESDGTTTPVAKPSDDEEPEDDIVEDFEIRLAQNILSSVSGSNRPKLVAAANKVITKVRADEEAKLVAELAKIGVDWSAPATGTTGAASLEVSLATSPTGTVKAGQEISVTATVKNSGAAAAYRVLARVRADDGVFDDTELPVGKVGPGETKTFTAKLKMPDDAYDRMDRLSVEVREARNAPSRVTPTEILVEAQPRPVFAYAYQLIDDGNGDGLVQSGEKYRLRVQLKNTGDGPTRAATVLLRNASGDNVELSKSRIELKDTPLAPGAIKEIEFPVTTRNGFDKDELSLELTAYDAQLDAQTTDKLVFKTRPSVAGTKSSGNVTAKSTATIRSGAADDAGVIGTAVKGATYPVLGTFGPYSKVKVDAAGTIGFITTQNVSSGGSGTASYTAEWNSTPPAIALSTKGLETTADTYKLSATITDETHVEDVYIFVSNRNAKIDSRKVFYKSNRSGADGKKLSIATDLPLWPGSNMITVVARTNAEVRSMKTMYVFRDPPRTASTTP